MDTVPSCRRRSRRRPTQAYLTVKPASQDKPSNSPCLCCGARKPGPEIASNEYRYVICQQCQAAALTPLPTDQSAAELYRQGYFDAAHHSGYADYAGDERLHRWNARRRLAIVSSHQPTGTLLEIGCALGFFLSEARDAGHSVAGVEVSRWARQQSQERFGLEIATGIESYGPASFDIACAFQVLEHIPRCDQTLREIHERLRPGGLLVIETWDRTSAVARLFRRHWQQISPPSVVHLYSRAGIHQLLDRQGFEPVKYLRTFKWTSFGFVPGLLAGKYRRSSSSYKPRISTSRLRAIPIPYFFGDLVTVVARKL